jgi:aminobenzoyl-glutamate utilization protein B
MFAVQTMADAAVTLYETPELVKQAKDENAMRTGGKPYECPIPADVIPVPFRKKKK